MAISPTVLKRERQDQALRISSLIEKELVRTANLVGETEKVKIPEAISPPIQELLKTEWLAPGSGWATMSFVVVEEQTTVELCPRS